MKSRVRAIILVGVVLLAGAGAWLFETWSVATPRSELTRTESAAAPRQVDARTTADRVLAALKASNGAALAELVAKVGVRLSPGAFVDVAADQVLSQDEVRNLWANKVRRVWGYAGGSGDPIDLTLAAYVSRHVLDHDFSDVKISVNADSDRDSSTGPEHGKP